MVSGSAVQRHVGLFQGDGVSLGLGLLYWRERWCTRAAGAFWGATILGRSCVSELVCGDSSGAVIVWESILGCGHTWPLSRRRVRASSRLLRPGLPPRSATTSSRKSASYSFCWPRTTRPRTMSLLMRKRSRISCFARSRTSSRMTIWKLGKENWIFWWT